MAILIRMNVKTTIGDRFASFAARGFIFLKMRSKKKRSFLKKTACDRWKDTFLPKMQLERF
jgi:hypothetical protein